MAVAIPIALALTGLLFVALGLDPLRVYATIVRGSLGTGYGLSEVLVEATPLLLVCSGLAIAYTAKYWNVGAEGQYSLGGIAVAVLSLAVPDLSPYVAVPVLLFVGAVAGGLYGTIAGALKAKLGVNEIVTTLMMNFIAAQLTSYLCWGPLMGKAEHGTGQPMTEPLPYTLPRLLSDPNYRVHIGIALALVLALVVYILVARTTLGYKIRLMGSNPEAARSGGVSISSSIVIVSFLSGALAGLAGAAMLLGITHRLSAYQGTFSTYAGYGYTGILVTLLGKSNPLGIVLSSVFVSILRTGSTFAYRTMGVPVYVVDVIIGLIILVSMSIEMITRYRR
jgi:simple sugar transport system permease protein